LSRRLLIVARETRLPQHVLTGYSRGSPAPKSGYNRPSNVGNTRNAEE